MHRDLRTIKQDTLGELDSQLQHVFASVLGDLEMTLSAQSCKNRYIAEDQHQMEQVANQLIYLHEGQSKIMRSLASFEASFEASRC
jgi:hypothetical protein